MLVIRAMLEQPIRCGNDVLDFRTRFRFQHGQCVDEHRLVRHHEGGLLEFCQRGASEDALLENRTGLQISVWRQQR